MVLPAIAVVGRAVVAGTVAGARTIARTSSKTTKGGASAVRNAKVIPKKSNVHYKQTITGDFEGRKSVEAKTLGEGVVQNADRQIRRQKLLRQEQSLSAREKALEQQIQMHAETKKKSGGGLLANFVKSKARWLFLSIASPFYIFQLWFAVESISLYIQGEIPLLGSFLGSKDEMLLYWALSSFVAISAFTIFSFLYRKLGTGVLETIGSFLVTMIAVLFSILPVLNLFPWLFVWIWFINVFSKSSTR